MFASIKSLTALIDKRIRFVNEAKAANLGDEKYYSEMKHLICGGLNELKRISSNQKLIKQYETKVIALYGKEAD